MKTAKRVLRRKAQYAAKAEEEAENPFIIVYKLILSLRNKADAKRFLIDVLYQNPGPPHLEGPSNDVKYFGLCTEGGDDFMKIKELQAYLDMVKKIVRPGCSEQVLKVALSSMSSLVNILTTMSST
ncbi:hypothetical protein LWI29_009972 [Acer saccharum]|uniref:Uncharacterized protein n=1 Tax=Acer saccharum TaxID=4024 RepID=A0AA39VKW4_ACESA|nr:hypothetical protein LWI29_009972 [Acer saccharum]